MFWQSSEQRRKKELEKNILFTMQIETTRIVNQDYVIYTFDEPIYIRSQAANTECYYWDDSYVPGPILNTTPGKFPFNPTIIAGGSAKYAVNSFNGVQPYTLGTYVRMRANQQWYFYPEPKRVRTMFIAPVSGQTVMTIHYML